MLEIIGIIFSYLIIPIISNNCFVPANSNNEKWKSIVCTSLVVLITLLQNTFSGCVAFLTYIIMDTFFRDDVLTLENSLHHITCIILTSVGIYIFDHNVEKIIFTLLMMEITTPILHLTVIYKDKILFALLLLLWIPFRLYYPIIQLHFFLHYFKNTFAYLLAKITLCILQLLQIFWFFKLCVRAKDEIIKKLQTKNEI